MNPTLSRRTLLTLAGATLTTLSEVPLMSPANAEPNAKHHFHYCLNTSTIRGQKLPLLEVIQIASKAGYHAIEPWIDEIQAYQAQGGTLKDLKKTLEDAHLTVESAIGFAEWIVDDPERRKKGLEIAKRDMELVAQIGGKRVAAPPMGMTDHSDLDFLKIAERYHALCVVGEQHGIDAMLELWGFSKTLNRLGFAIAVAMESNHPKACVLTDVYHIYKGGSDHAEIGFVQGKFLPIIHVNDYPNIVRETITDADRVYPGDGIAPLTSFFQDLKTIGFQGHLSLELFNEGYYKQDPLTVAKTGLEKTKAAVHKALG